MIGLIQNNQGKTLEYPIIPSYFEGLSPIEYFVITHGARKGASDTALNTAKAGYLTAGWWMSHKMWSLPKKIAARKKGKWLPAKIFPALKFRFPKISADECWRPI